MGCPVLRIVWQEASHVIVGKTVFGVVDFLIIIAELVVQHPAQQAATQVNQRGQSGNGDTICTDRYTYPGDVPWPGRQCDESGAMEALTFGRSCLRCGAELLGRSTPTLEWTPVEAAALPATPWATTRATSLTHKLHVLAEIPEVDFTSRDADRK